MSNDRLGRNPFDRASYSEPATAKPKTAKARAKKSGAKRGPQARARKADAPTWRLILDEIEKISPPAIRQLGICKKAAALADLAAAKLSQVARQLDA